MPRLVLIGPNWASSKDQTGNRRLNDEHDWVRKEVEAALSAPNLDIVPVLVNDASMPSIEELPPSIQSLVKRHAAVVRPDPDFHADVARLVMALRTHLKTGVLEFARPPASGHGDFGRAMLLRAGWILGAGALTVLALGVALGWWRPDVQEQAPSIQIADARTTPANIAAPVLRDTRDLPDFALFRDCETCPEMVVLPAGSFVMSTDRDAYRGPQTHFRRFAVGRFEVTIEQWQACVRANACPSPAYETSNSRSVDLITWADTQRYVGWLSRETGEAYRLLSESEWDYSKNPMWTTANAPILTEYATLTPAGPYSGNSFGIYEMPDNALEWVEDCWTEDHVMRPSDGAALTTSGDCTRRVARGGEHDFDRSLRLRPEEPFALHLGFRVARAVTQ